MSSDTQDGVPKSVKEIWEKTILRFQERTGFALDSTPKSPDDLRKTLNVYYDQQTDDEQAIKAKEMGLKIVSCIQILGDFAAQGASGVFAPASLCFKALSCLLDIPKKIHKFHGEINLIFAEIGPAIAQFRIYQRMDENTGVDESLRACIYEVMVSFIDICANWINVHKEGKWKSLKHNTIKILLDDGSVQTEIDNFKQLTKRQLDIQATLTLEAAIDTKEYVNYIKTTTVEIETSTKAIKTDVSSLVEADQKRGLDETRKQHLTSIRTKLGISDEQLANVNDLRDNMWKNSIENGGKWLNDLDQYSQWVERNTAENLLLVTGDPGTGKSYLVSAIARDIKSQDLTSTSKAERSLIGYYSFSLAAKENNRRPETAVKIICTQLAEQEFVYAKNVAAICGEKEDKFFRDADCLRLWTTLGIDSPVKNTTHYIILDSVSSLDAAELEQLMLALQYKPLLSAEDNDNRVRILASGEPKSFLPDSADVKPVPTIDITQYNSDDIRIFIGNELRKADLFQGEDEDSKRLSETVQERLLTRSNSSYLTVRQDLEKVKEISSSGGTEEELNQVLLESSADVKELVRSDIETLETVLKPREIEEINQLLIWVVAGYAWLNIEHLTAALFLHFNTVSLQPLIQKITGKYSKIFTLIYSDDCLALKDYVEEHVVTKRKKPRESVDDPKINATITISNANMKSVQRFLWDLNNHIFSQEFSFQSGSELNESFHGKIQLNRVDAHLAIIKQAFGFLRDPSVDHRGKSIGLYLMAYIPKHLRFLYNVSGFDKLQEGDKQYIGTCVNEMFSVGDWIENNWEYRSWATWYQERESIAICWKWLDDEEAISRLGPRDKRWLDDIKKEEDRNQALLTPIMTTVARHWLQRDDWDVLDACKWIRGFLEMSEAESSSESGSETVSSGASITTKGHSEDGSDDGSITSDDGDSGDDSDDSNDSSDNDDSDDNEDSDDSSSVSTTSDKSTANKSEGVTIQRAAEWCKNALDVKEVDYTWCIRLGTTFSRSSEPLLAIEQYEQAASILQAQDPINKEKLCYVFTTLGEWSTSVETALGYYKKAEEQDPCNVEIMHAILKRYISANKIDEARLIIQKVLTEKTPNSESTVLSALLKSVMKDTNEKNSLSMVLAIISLTVPSPEWSAVVQVEIERAIESAREEQKTDELAALLFHLGIAAYYFRKNDSREELAKAVGNWRECLVTLREKVEVNDRSRLKLVEQNSIHYLSMVYLEQPQEVPEDVFQDDQVIPTTKYALASHYTSTGKKDEAQNLLRSEMVAAFNILCDDDVSNDGLGYSMLLSILNHTGDYENSFRASLLLPKWKFDQEVLQALLTSEDASLNDASAKILEFYQSNCLNSADQRGNFDKVLNEAKRLSGEATGGDSENDSAYKTIFSILEQLLTSCDHSFWCDNCGQQWDYENSLHVCKKCYKMDLCDGCWNKIRSTEPTVFVCSRSHDWWEQEMWTMERYIHSCKKLVSMTSRDGSIELITVSKWLGILCEQWGLSKADWKFE
ncbi:hypothetical protein BGW36DRAFT_381275 [Talaromyces proteolyticus]|uniref:Fungal STAND N-terminal Goodbye domain-containing protein n=1 Tax=Talaromyces proteolyticus TaxID=1131652 RepID=A0AAD4PZP4_9EURO|nr:uncharacterized protein BGW36DRAFT_381275 [Talaromyces proteolyticus]KAH8696577.1 hypothetical protein BGW36DRAFT_381275 [Talaromyces proteolyticus]